MLLKAQNIDINSKDNEGCTALHHAARLGTPEMLDLLLKEQNIDINSKDNEGRTALHYAARLGTPEMLNMLLKAQNIDINSKDNRGYTALHYAAMQEPKNIEILLQARANINILSNSSCLPMDYIYTNPSVKELFIQNNGISTIEERKLVHLGLKIGSEYNFEGLLPHSVFTTFKESLEKLNEQRIDAIKEKHTDQQKNLDMLKKVIGNVQEKISYLARTESQKHLNNASDFREQILADHKTKCQNLKPGDHHIIESGSKVHTNYLVINLEEDGTYRVQLCERSGHVMKNGRAVVPYINVSKEELHKVIEKASGALYEEHEDSKKILFGGEEYTSTLFGFNAKVRDDIEMTRFSRGTCSISNLKTATRLILMDNIKAADQHLEPEDRVWPEDVYKVYSAAIFDITLEDYTKSKETFFQGDKKAEIIEQAKAHSEKKWEKIRFKTLFNGLRLQEVQQLIDDNPDIVNEKNSKGQTHLHIAVSEGDIEVVEILLKAGAVDSQDKSGSTALKIAESRKDNEMITLLNGNNIEKTIQTSTHDDSKAIPDDHHIKTLVDLITDQAFKNNTGNHEKIKEQLYKAFVEILAENKDDKTFPLYDLIANSPKDYANKHFIDSCAEAVAQSHEMKDKNIAVHFHLKQAIKTISKTWEREQKIGKDIANIKAEIQKARGKGGRDENASSTEKGKGNSQQR